MYKLIESADYDTLFAAYLADHDHYTGGVFSEYDLIISTLPEGDILLQKLADARGIASGVRPRYWTSFYWRLVEHITGYTPRGEQTPLNNTAIRWHLYTATAIPSSPTPRTRFTRTCTNTGRRPPASPPT